MTSAPGSCSGPRFGGKRQGRALDADRDRGRPGEAQRSARRADDLRRCLPAGCLHAAGGRAHAARSGGAFPRWRLRRQRRGSDTANAGKEIDLGFGVDDRVQVVRIALDRETGEHGILTSRKTDTRRYKITVENLHTRPMDITVLDRVPYAEDEKSRCAARRIERADGRKRRRPARRPGVELHLRAGRGARDPQRLRGELAGRRVGGFAGLTARCAAAKQVASPPASRYSPAGHAPAPKAGHRRLGTAGDTPEKWPMWSSSARSGATKARARSSTGCRSAPTWSCASRAATMPATRWSSTASSYKL